MSPTYINTEDFKMGKIIQFPGADRKVTENETDETSAGTTEGAPPKVRFGMNVGKSTAIVPSPDVEVGATLGKEHTNVNVEEVYPKHLTFNPRGAEKKVTGELKLLKSKLRMYHRMFEAALMSLYTEADGARIFTIALDRGTSGVPARLFKSTGSESDPRCVVLNLSMAAIHTRGPILLLSENPINDCLQFGCSFNGAIHEVMVSLDAISSVYSPDIPGLAMPNQFLAELQLHGQRLRAYIDATKK